uniref:Protein RCC2 n=1 Tax=Solanum tuberosum TaxID=4113 RepID=M0ZWG4_SOLTU
MYLNLKMRRSKIVMMKVMTMRNNRMGGPSLPAGVEERLLAKLQLLKRVLVVEGVGLQQQTKAPHLKGKYRQGKGVGRGNRKSTAFLVKI